MTRWLSLADGSILIIVKSYPRKYSVDWAEDNSSTQIAKFMGPTWGPPGSRRPQIGRWRRCTDSTRECYWSHKKQFLTGIIPLYGEFHRYYINNNAQTFLALLLVELSQLPHSNSIWWITQFGNISTHQGRDSQKMFSIEVPYYLSQ